MAGEADASAAGLSVLDHDWNNLGLTLSVSDFTGARVAELGHQGRRAEDLIRRLGLPEEWGQWRR